MVKCDKCNKEEEDLDKIYYCYCDKICCENCRFCSIKCKHMHRIDWEVFDEMKNEIFDNNLKPSCLCLWPGKCSNEDCEFKRRCMIKYNKLKS